ncbi:sugar ABC transporter substrate-binding protein [Pseudobutyrivibrio ruminis]|uniref:sugar ABC transporter substrate-binding protein n=1 Tax=Pseudobutyrivibrio ruminis TaxID=46206 RepID=UPI00051ADA8F|nr:substrate-binding domain-containing protein [Pseudobutyrivibrio ruminis]
MKKIVVMTLSLAMLSGCASSSADSANTSSNKEDSIEIGLCFDSFVIERWEKDRDVFVDTASSLGATVNVQNANGDVEKQIEQITYLIDKGVDCLVIIPVDGEALTDVIKTAKEKDIAVVCYDRIIPNADTDLYISFDNNMVGQMLGEALANSGAKSVVMICGPLTDGNVPMVNDGFYSVMNENDIEILDTYYCEGWKAELGGAYVYDNLDTIKEADAIMCGNDDVATSVIRALAVCQLAGVKPVVGQDADLPACQHVVEGTQLMTVFKPVSKLAEQAAQLSVQLASGEDIDVNSTISDGQYDIPYVATEPVAVTRDNIDEVIIDSGFHSKEDVYMNVSNESDENE